ncbi:hypothetical protein AMS69_15710 [Haloarcula rubripromontorii]|uniref:Uncharacterized protein n=1 Tax=Haloarcula rubripromontorii TaxID=1705562 RepID=A0A0M9AJM8_9EURY|nr:hypothetical protein [Haloarcula rubripromontorii]KOX91991.1 hypothetical protein AMS69_15710 [Haloarcula rubripromontorii]
MGEQADRRSLLTTVLDLLDSLTNIVVGRLQESRRTDKLITSEWPVGGLGEVAFRRHADHLREMLENCTPSE